MYPIDSNDSGRLSYAIRNMESLAQQRNSVFYKQFKMVGYGFREELLQIVILLRIGNHIFRNVVTLVSACKLRQSKKTCIHQLI